MPPQGISLFQLNNKIKLHIQETFPSEIWIVAEISELRENRTGHCYLELIEKEDSSENIIAKAKATIWAYTYRMIKPFFETTTGQSLSSGIKVLIKVSVEYQELYGLSLNIKDIDPSYTLGDIARRKKEILQKLEREGVSQMNQELEMPPLPKTIAIISSPTAAGYEDFTNQLQSNQSGYAFHYRLFPATMQGALAEASIIDALDQIYQYEDLFDVVVIIRGGGSQADLNSFDSYWLAYNIAQFPIPVIAGIGHERDETIVDIVAHTSVKTPTAAAEFLIDCFFSFQTYTQELEETFFKGIEELISYAREQLQSTSRQFSPFVKQILERKRNTILLCEQKLISQSHKFISKEINTLKQFYSSLELSLSQRISREESLLQQTQLKHRNVCNTLLQKQSHKLELISQTLKYINPENILKKGYSLTLKDGKVVKDINQLNNLDRIETRLSNGRVYSRIEEKEISSN